MASNLVVRASGPAKIILFGEHSVVYGHPAIAAAIGGRTFVEITERNEPGVALHFPLIDNEIVLLYPFDATPLELRNVLHFKSVECALKICKFFGHIFKGGEARGIDVKVSSELPVGAGLGSSASFSVAMCAAFHAYELFVTGKPLELDLAGSAIISEEFASLVECVAFDCEKIFHGTPSGIDTAVSTHGGIVKFQRNNSNTSFEKIADSLPLKIAIVDSEVPRQTSALAQSVKDLKSRHPVVVEGILQAMGEVAKRAALKPTSESLIELARINHGLLYALGVSHPVLEKINATVAGSGVGFKLTGAGGGGNAILFIPPDIDENDIITKLKDSGFKKVSMVSLGGPGLQVSVNDKSSS